MRPTFMTIVFNLQAAKSSTAFSCLFGKMRKYIFYRKKCGWQYHFSCCDGCKRIDFQFLCLPKRKICAQSKKKKKTKLIFFGVLGNCNAFIMNEQIGKVSQFAGRGAYVGEIQPWRLRRSPEIVHSFHWVVCKYTRNIYIYIRLWICCWGKKLREISLGPYKLYLLSIERRKNLLKIVPLRVKFNFKRKWVSFSICYAKLYIIIFPNISQPDYAAPFANCEGYRTFCFYACELP